MSRERDDIGELEPLIVLGEEGSPAMRARRDALYRYMTASEKLGVLFCLNTIADAFERAYVRRQYPGADEDEVTLLLVERRYGAEIAAKLRVQGHG